jgi:uncharacterized membrane protein YeaQ/YmgE (transglycosylase-associated protein family)
MQVVGVVEDVRNESPDREAYPDIFVDYRQVLELWRRSGESTGIALGLVGAAAATRLLQGMLFGVTALDATTFIAVAVMSGLVATLASYVPARRATQVDPMVALRSE